MKWGLFKVLHNGLCHGDFNIHGVNDMAFSNNMMKKVFDNEINRNINNAGFWDKYDFIETFV
jgi:hypothetical protein